MQYYYSYLEDISSFESFVITSHISLYHHKIMYGLADGMDFPAKVASFILRGINLYSIDSLMAPIELREQA